MVQTRKQFAYDRLRDQMRRGKLLPGDRLGEVPLARQMQVSRGPLREAINQLASEGLIEQVPGLGSYVRRPDLREIEEIYETREALELFCVEKAAARMTEDGLGRLQECCDRMRELLELYRSHSNWDEAHRQALLDADTEFHELISGIAGNSRIAKLLEDHRLLQRMLAYNDRLGSASTLSTRSWAWAQHKRILRALHARDAGAARMAMMDHIRAAKKNAMAAYRALQERPSYDSDLTSGTSRRSEEQLP